MKTLLIILLLASLASCATHAEVTLRCSHPDQRMTVNVNDTGEEVYMSATCKWE